MFSKKIKTQKKAILIASLLFLFAFSFTAHSVDAVTRMDCAPFADGFKECWDSGGEKSNATSPLLWALNLILYAVFVFVSYPISLAASLLGYALDPLAVKNLFGMNSIYVLWQMIRDFFNLFFILTLLFIAFATIFQIDSFNYKKTLGKLLLMALLVNFSFPIARFVIDATNVPMYFFLESTFKDKTQASGKNIVEAAFSASNMRGIILPSNNSDGGYMVHGNSKASLQLMTAIVFMFLFGVSLLVLAILFTIRSFMLVVLVIFSSVGFAGMVIPGFRQYAAKWWDNLLKYALFGPAAALMLLISVTFMQEFASNGNPNADLTKFVSSTGGDDTYLASMASVLVPVILIWMSITIGQTMGIAGAGMVTQRAQQFSKWVGRKASGVDAVQKRWKAYSSERDKRAAAKFAATNIGTRLATKANAKLDQLSAKRIGGRFETEAARHARLQEAERQKTRVAEAKKAHMLDQTSDKDLLEMKRQAAEGKAKTKDQKALHVAATQEIAKRKLDENSGEPGHGYSKDEAEKDMQAIRENFAEMPGGVSNAVQADTEKQVAQAYTEAAYKNVNGVLDESKLRDAIRKGDIDASKVSSAGMTANFVRLAAQEGKMNEKLIDEYQKANPHVDMGKIVGEAITASNASLAAHQATAAPAVGTREREEYDRKTKQLQKSQQELNRSYLRQTGDYHASVTTDDQRKEILKKADHETLGKMADNPNKGILAYNINLMAQAAGPGKTAAVLARMSEEGKDIQKSVDELKSTADNIGSAGQQAAEKAIDRMQADYRFKGTV